MKCDRCGREAVHFQRYSGLRLCGEHLAASLEARAKGLIRARGWIRPGDRIAVCLSGGPSSSSLLRFLSANFGMRRDLSLVAVTVDDGGRDMERVKAMAEGMGIGWAGVSLEDLWGDQDPSSPCSRDRALASLASQVGATRMALGTSLDDEAGAVFLHVIRGEAARLAAPPAGEGEGILFQRGLNPSRGAPAHPWTGGATSCLLLPGRSRLGPEGPQPPETPPARSRGPPLPPGQLRLLRSRRSSEPGPPAGPGIPVIRPFSRIPEEELVLYARLQGIDSFREESRCDPGDLRMETARMLGEYTRRHPSALFSIANLGEALAGYGRSGKGGPGREADRG